MNKKVDGQGKAKQAREQDKTYTGPHERCFDLVDEEIWHQRYETTDEITG